MFFKISVGHKGGFATTETIVDAPSNAAARRWFNKYIKDHPSLEGTPFEIQPGCSGNPCMRKHVFSVEKVRPAFIIGK